MSGRGGLRFPIATPRLLIRPFEPPDLRDAHALFRNPELWRFNDYPRPTSIDDTERRLELYAATEREDGFTFWAVIERATGKLIGDCGLVPLAWRGPEVEVGFRIAPSRWGRGFATEATAASLVAGFEVLGLSEIIGRAKPENTASRRVMEKAGMVSCGRQSIGGGQWAMYRLTRGAWKRRGAGR